MATHRTKQRLRPAPCCPTSFATTAPGQPTSPISARPTPSTARGGTDRSCGPGGGRPDATPDARARPASSLARTLRQRASRRADASPAIGGAAAIRFGRWRSGRNLPGPGPQVQDGTAPEHLRVFAGQAAITSPLTSTHRADQCKQERTAPADDVAHRCLNFRCEIEQRVPDLVFLLWQVLGSEPTLAEPTVLTAI